MEIYYGHGVAYFENMKVVNWIINLNVLEFFIIEFMESDNVGIWSCIVYLKCYIQMHEILDLFIKERGLKEQNLSNDCIILKKKR